MFTVEMLCFILNTDLIFDELILMTNIEDFTKNSFYHISI